MFSFTCFLSRVFSITCKKPLKVKGKLQVTKDSLQNSYIRNSRLVKLSDEFDKSLHIIAILNQQKVIKLEISCIILTEKNSFQLCDVNFGRFVLQFEEY